MKHKFDLFDITQLPQLPANSSVHRATRILVCMSQTAEYFDVNLHTAEGKNI